MNEMMYELALTGVAFGLSVGLGAAFTGYMVGLGFKLLNRFTH